MNKNSAGPEIYIVKSIQCTSTNSILSSHTREHGEYSTISAANNAIENIFYQYNPFGTTSSVKKSDADASTTHDSTVDSDYDSAGLLSLSTASVDCNRWIVKGVTEMNRNSKMRYISAEGHSPERILSDESISAGLPLYSSDGVPVFEIEEILGNSGNVYVIWTNLDDKHSVTMKWEYFNGTSWVMWKGRQFRDKFMLTYRAGMRCLTPSPLFSCALCKDNVKTIRSTIINSHGHVIGVYEHTYWEIRDETISTSLSTMPTCAYTSTTSTLLVPAHSVTTIGDNEPFKKKSRTIKEEDSTQRSLAPASIYANSHQLMHSNDGARLTAESGYRLAKTPTISFLLKTTGASSHRSRDAIELPNATEESNKRKAFALPQKERISVEMSGDKQINGSEASCVDLLLHAATVVEDNPESDSSEQPIHRYSMSEFDTKESSKGRKKFKLHYDKSSGPKKRYDFAGRKDKFAKLLVVYTHVLAHKRREAEIERETRLERWLAAEVNEMISIDSSFINPDNYMQRDY